MHKIFMDVFDMPDYSSVIPDEVMLEGITSVSALIKSVRAGTSRRRIHYIAIDKVKTKTERGRFSFLSHASAELGFELRILDGAQIDALVLGKTHGGIVAAVSPAVYAVPTSTDIVPDGCAAIIEGAEDPYTLGYSLRALYAAGFDSVILPSRELSTAESVLARASAGAGELIGLYMSDELPAVADMYKTAGYSIVCAGIRNSIPLYEAPLKAPVLLIIGGEKRGISSSLAAKADFTVSIPYGREFLGSLSTASAVAVLAFETLRQNRRTLT